MSNTSDCAAKHIEAAHREWMAALDVVNDPIFLHDKDFRVLRCNKAYQQLAGIPYDQIIGRPYYDIFPLTHQPLPGCRRAMASVVLAEEEEEEEEEEVVVGLSVFRSRSRSAHDERGVYLYSVHTLEDITEHKRMVMAVLESEERFRKISETAQDAIIMMGADKCISFWNSSAERIFGYTANEALGQDLHKLLVSDAARTRFEQGFPHFQAIGEGTVIGKVSEVTALRKGGVEFPVELSLSALQLAGQWHAIAILRDISERKAAEEMLALQGRIAVIFTTVPDDDELFNEVLKLVLRVMCSPFGVFGYLDQTGALVVPTMTRQIWDKCQMPGKTIYFPRESWGDSSWPCALREKKVVYSNASSNGIPEGHVRILRHISMPILFQDQAIGLFQVANKEMDYTDEDISTLHNIALHVAPLLNSLLQRKQWKREIQHANRALRTLSEGNQALIRAMDELGLLQAMCHAAVDKGGYRMAWVGYVEQDAKHSIRPVAQAGIDQGYLAQANISWADDERGQGPSGRAVRSRSTQVVQNIALDPSMLPWREEAISHGYAATVALPLLRDEQCLGVLVMYAAEPEAFDAGELALLEEMASDLAFGIDALRIRNQQREQAQRLQKNMLQTVEAIGGMVEMRDPYTAGHQLRVADLSQSIARQMGLPEDEVQAIYLAGLVHDLGKIRVPAEILSKPGQLDEIEFSLIKLHPRAGYDILKGIDFSWPIAQMVLQHHERMDGTGYPQELKGEEILLGARILSVADVVEAISSHRPYRPGLGVEAALDELLTHPERYDQAVVQACLQLFREESYCF